ncbi:MAG TPA: Ldh family oxidoreductase, partial [Gammaproteobacteria bacterium]|nr:Ldh family oxidoreductase [Gammaproteobacteria bacterium]
MTDTTHTAAVRVDPGELADWASAALRASGVPDTDARLVADSLVQTSLWGIDTHGIARLPHYLGRLEAGSTRARPTLQLTRTAAGTATLEGDHGLGIVICERAMREAVTLASESGVGVVGCRHSTHCGALGLYGRQAVRAGMIGFAFTHADAIVAPHGGSRAFLGTNPICIAVPNAHGQAVCLDMATSAIPFNRVINARRDGGSLPDNVAVDSSGQPTTDAHAAAALRPMGEHKGYALAFLIDVLCG